MALRTLYTVLEETASQHGSLPALHQPIGTKGKYRSYTWNEYRDIAREIAAGLRSIGVGKGDIVALHAESRAEFYLCDLGILANGSIAAALYTSLPPAEHVKTIAQVEPRAMIVEDPKTLVALRDAGVGVPGMKWILMTGMGSDAMTLDQLRQRGRSALTEDPTLFDRIRKEVDPHDPAILYMTSGATGEPKMGLASHMAVVSNIDMAPVVLPLDPHDCTVVFLPSAHIAQRVVLEFVPVRCGAQVYFSEGLAKLPNELRSIKPTFLLAPPRVWERVYASVSTEIRKRPALTRRMFYTALGLGLKAATLRQHGQPVPAWMQRSLRVADRLVFRKIRERLGGRLRLAASGAAPLGRDLARFYEAIGMPLIEGYGLTEGGVVSLNPFDAPRPGSIGKPLPNVQVRLAPDGELLVQSPNLFLGYYNDPEGTAEVLRDGWLHTGDIAEIDSEGYIYITGRKKELIVSSNGKKIYPARIENLFKVEPLINQVLLIGDRQPYVTALVTVNAAAAKTIKGLEDIPEQEIAHSDSVRLEVEEAVKRVNAQLAPFEQIKRFRILERDFSIDRGELTPTMKIRRTQVLENYRAMVSQLYLGKEEMA
jgi:long-chain acyl-CoA synthetase